MIIIPLDKSHKKFFESTFNKSFKDRSVPYGNIITADFLEKRVFSSSIYSTDCSKVILSNSGKICGFFIANLRSQPTEKKLNHLFLNLFFITPEYRRLGFGQELINTLVNTAKKHEKNKIITSLQWNGIWPGILSNWKDTIIFCQHTNGQLNSGEIFIELNLDTQSTFELFNRNKRNTHEKIRHYIDNDFHDLKKLLTNNFNTAWVHETLNKVNKKFDNFNGYGLSYPYNPKDVLILEHRETICGFCVVQSISKGQQAFLGPIGIIHELRGKGFGTKLFSEAINHLKIKGKTKIGLWTNNTIFEGFYKKFGLQKTFETVHAEWNV